MTKLIIALVALISIPLFAAEVKIVTITSNVDRDTTEFFLDVVEDGSIDGMHFITKNGRGVVTQDQRATVEEVIDSGIVLFREGNREVVRMKVKNLNVETGGEVIVDYLYSGVNNSRRNLKLNLKKTTGNFFLELASGTQVNHLKIYGNWVPVIGLVGISDIRALNLRHPQE